MSEGTKAVRGKNVIGRIVGYFARHPNQVVTVQTLSASMRLSEERIRNSLNSFRHFHRDDPDHVSKRIRTVIRGQSWEYVVPELPVPDESPKSESPVRLNSPTPGDRHSSAQAAASSIEVSADALVSKLAPIASSAIAGLPTKRVFEEVGPITGGFVIRDEDDVLYRATRL